MTTLDFICLEKFSLALGRGVRVAVLLRMKMKLNKSIFNFCLIVLCVHYCWFNKFLLKNSAFECCYVYLALTNGFSNFYLIYVTVFTKISNTDLYEFVKFITYVLIFGGKCGFQLHYFSCHGIFGEPVCHAVFEDYVHIYLWLIFCYLYHSAFPL